jgi:phosphonopyruvate decarboxylase
LIPASRFAAAARERGFTLWSGVPCSYLKPFINHVIDSPDLRYIAAANEGDAVATAAGAQLGGSRGIAMFQNSGLGNAVNPLTSLTYTFRIPILVIVTLRGDPEGPADAPQHELMGRITGRMLETMSIPWELFPTEEAEISEVLDRAVGHMEDTGLPYALVMKKGSVEPWKLESTPDLQQPDREGTPPPVVPEASRREILQAIQRSSVPADSVIASTGYGGRELYALEDRPNQLYMVGSMGCASSLGLGLAVTRPQGRVIVCDGDGAVIMRMGALATNGTQRPGNLLHVVLDNGMHESTGGQSTVSRAIDLCAVARACGYPRVLRSGQADEVADIISRGTTELTLLHVPIQPGTASDLPRPSMTPAEMAVRFRRHLEENA